MMKKTIMALCGVFAATAFLNAADANLMTRREVVSYEAL